MKNKYSIFSLARNALGYLWRELRQGELVLLWHDLPEERVREVAANVGRRLEEVKSVLGIVTAPPMKATTHPNSNRTAITTAPTEIISPVPGPRTRAGTTQRRPRSSPLELNSVEEKNHPEGESGHNLQSWVSGHHLDESESAAAEGQTETQEDEWKRKR